MTRHDFSGLWRSRYAYRSSSRDGEFAVERTVRLQQKDNRLVAESVPESNRSYIFIRLTLDDGVATDSWQEQTEKDGYYGGAVYHGAIQLVADTDGNRLRGKWIGFGKDGEVNTGPWELERIDDK